MQSRRAILVNGSRLMREIVTYLIEKKMGFNVIRELRDVDELPGAILETEADWIFVLFPSKHNFHGAQRIDLLAHYPHLRIILWEESGEITMERTGRTPNEFTGNTLDELNLFWAG